MPRQLVFFPIPSMLSERRATAASWESLSFMPADVFIGGWMNCDQFDLTLPPEFLLACGRLGLPIDIYTND